MPRPSQTLRLESTEGFARVPESGHKETLPDACPEGISARERQTRRRESIPAPIREEVVLLAKRLTELFGSVFSSRQRLKHAVGRLLVSQLPPRSRSPGRPGLVAVSRAIRLREKLRRTRPEMTDKEIWREEIYWRVIPQYATLAAIERREAEDELRRRVCWRLSARRRRQRRKPRVEPKRPASEVRITLTPNSQ